jgi:glycerophosphoryl diester phosphodiesterase
MPYVWGHRGASAYAPENTLPAFNLAREMGAVGVELDVQLTADGRLVCIHDETLDRTTTGAGPVGTRTLDELKVYEATNGMSGFAGTTIPTLDEVFELYAGTDMVVNVELKNSVMPYHGMEEKVLALVDAAGMQNRVLLSTFNHISLVKLHELGTTVPTAMLFGEPLFRPWRYAQTLHVSGINPPHQYLRYVPKLVARAKELGLTVNPWTVNDADDMRRVIDLDVDAIITNFPDRALALL